MTNAELGKRIHNGDESAFSVFFNRHYGWVYRRAFKVLRCHEDAEDTASNVFVKAWKYREKYNKALGEFMGWFNVLCSRTIIDAKRIKQTAKDNCRYGDLLTVEDHALMEHVPDTRRSALDVLISEEQQIQIEDALCEIQNPHHRLAWILRYFEDYKYPEIGRILNTTEGTCKGWVYRCNQNLQRILSDA